MFLRCDDPHAVTTTSSVSCVTKIPSLCPRKLLGREDSSQIYATRSACRQTERPIGITSLDGVREGRRLETSDMW